MRSTPWITDVKERSSSEQSSCAAADLHSDSIILITRSQRRMKMFSFPNMRESLLVFRWCLRTEDETKQSNTSSDVLCHTHLDGLLLFEPAVQEREIPSVQTYFNVSKAF